MIQLIMIALRKKFTTKTALFWPVTLGYVVSCALMVIPLLTRFVNDGYMAFPMFFAAGLVYGLPGYIASLIIFHRAKKKNPARGILVFKGLSCGALIATAWMLAILYPDYAHLSDMAVETACFFFTMYMLAGTVCACVTLFFFHLFDKRSDKHHDN